MKRCVFIILALCGISAAAKDADPLGIKIISTTHYSCLNTIASGLNWEGNRWVNRTFHAFGQFQLEVVLFDSLNQHWREINLQGDSLKHHCSKQLEIFDLNANSCTNMGATINFSESSMKGGISYLLGSESDEGEKDSLMVAPFTCQKL